MSRIRAWGSREPAPTNRHGQEPALRSRRWLRRLSVARQGEVRISCAHEAVELDIVAAEAAHVPAAAVGAGAQDRRDIAMG